MDKKRSKGVTFWGWIFIIFAVIGLLSVISPQQLLKLCGVWVVIYSVISALAYLICGIFILKLNNSARKAAIALGIISIIVMPFYFKPMVQQMNSDEFYSKSNQAYIEQMKPELRQKALENPEKGKEVPRKVLPIIFIVIFGVPILIFELVPIYFFTRLKVKEQFK